MHRHLTSYSRAGLSSVYTPFLLYSCPILAFFGRFRFCRFLLCNKYCYDYCYKWVEIHHKYRYKYRYKYRHKYRHKYRYKYRHKSVEIRHKTHHKVGPISY